MDTNIDTYNTHIKHMHPVHSRRQQTGCGGGSHRCPVTGTLECDVDITMSLPVGVTWSICGVRQCCCCASCLSSLSFVAAPSQHHLLHLLIKCSKFSPFNPAIVLLGLPLLCAFWCVCLPFGSCATNSLFCVCV